MSTTSTVTADDRNCQKIVAFLESQPDMMFVDASGGATGQLGSKLDINPTTIGKCLKDMEEKGMIRIDRPLTSGGQVNMRRTNSVQLLQGIPTGGDGPLPVADNPDADLFSDVDLMINEAGKKREEAEQLVHDANMMFTERAAQQLDLIAKKASDLNLTSLADVVSMSHNEIAAQASASEPSTEG